MTSYAPIYGFDPRDNVPSNGSELSAILDHSMEEAKAKEQSLEGLLGIGMQWVMRTDIETHETRITRTF